MKRTFLYLATTLAIHFSALAETQVPSLMNYQGHVTNAAGVAIGTGSSVNRSVTFRFWKSATDTAAEMRLYSETQTVTILNGDFSVLIGSGAPVEGEANSVASVAEVFANKEVFLGITVDDDNAATTDAEVSPRQQLVSTAFAFRSSVAESVDSGAISNTMLAANAVDTNQLKTSSVTLDKLATDAVNSSAIVDGSVTGADIMNDTIKAEDIATGGVGSLEILDGTIATADIANLAVTTGKIAKDTILAGNIAAGAVGTSEIATNAVTTTQIKDATITGTDIAANTITYDKLKATTQLTVTSNRVGIGTTTPTQGRLVVSGSVTGSGAGDTGYLGATFLGVNFYYTKQINKASSGEAGISTTAANHPATSIYATDAIWSGTNLVSSSDQRIKNVQGRSDRAKDLQTLLGIEVTDYRYKDVIGKGNVPQKKVIAQQVEKVFPQAVSSQTDAVPDIYQPARIKDGWITLATDLKPGERVKLISKNEEGVHEVLETAEGKFRTGFTGTAEEVFVYGREVNDFRTVDYDAIAMLNVSATQELKLEVDALRAENARLRNVLEARLSALEQGRSEGDAVPVSASTSLR